MAPRRRPGEIRIPGRGRARLPVRLDREAGDTDSLAGWLEAYFAVEVTTAESSRAVQRRDLGRFVASCSPRRDQTSGACWTSRLSRAFLDALRREVDRGRPTPLLRPDHRPHHRAPEDLRQVDPLAAPLPPRQPDRQAQNRGHRPRPRDRTGTLRTRATQAPRRRRPPAGPGRPLEATAGAARRWSSPTSGPGARATGPSATGRSSTPRSAPACAAPPSATSTSTESISTSTPSRVREKGGQTHRYKISREAVKAIADYLARSGGTTPRCSRGRRRSSCRPRR